MIMIKLTMLKRHWIFFLMLVIFLLLLAKNPFSVRTLIPNLEPYPDTIHYINPALSFIQGHGLRIWREGRGLMTTVPPLYTIFLVPLFLIKQDARMFYFTNVILALFSYLFFYLIINRLTYEVRRHNEKTASVLIGTTLFIYVTNYFIYWYPTLAMSENLTLFLFMGGVYLLTLPTTRKNIILAGLTAVAFYITKYASIPLTGTYFLSYGVKIIIEKGDKLKNVLILILVSAFVFLAYSLWEWQTKGSTLLMTLIGVFLPQKGSTIFSSGSWFSLNYAAKNLPRYIHALFGGYAAPFLWDQTPIVPKMVGTLGLTGLILGGLSKKTRFLSISLSSILLSSILFMSTFYSFDMRYLNFAIPTLMIGFVMFWMLIIERLDPRPSPKMTGKNTLFKLGSIVIPVKTGIQSAITLFLCFLFLYYSATNFIRIKSQISINLRYAETPWYYLSIIKMNEYFSTLPETEKKPVVISSVIPYYIDFYSNKTYDLLPLSKHQEFRNHKTEAWGNHDYADLLKIYEEYLSRGYNVYVDNYGLGNEKVLQDDHTLIHRTFKTELVSEGCLGACNIWKLHLK
ncbi:hypothetical protein COY90_01690 [Candidatus Roizmanbacteria bacterium CG_4_10_14_0_8_um_filter_39_9]|uniref:Glycosyltransferase RgtA/B/C/D-like domain-containing protein n=1 Tax=Candidatus Roizmanbacteria bacterium CG_4_10_14_0_8_um_filter_39_9 TaxID=1974829 RepID=A0A2M7QDC5_9BACT|nr:MAG: hypothetical protein COY90_01690 [Candidatus Roizmanbacteria bacterium CG_4_10_14_0_8_um_filter_39_9]